MSGRWGAELTRASSTTESPDVLEGIRLRVLTKVPLGVEVEGIGIELRVVNDSPECRVRSIFS